MLLYFPQDTPVELGPTAIMPVIHATNNSVADWLFICLPTCLLAAAA